MSQKLVQQQASAVQLISFASDQAMALDCLLPGTTLILIISRVSLVNQKITNALASQDYETLNSLIKTNCLIRVLSWLKELFQRDSRTHSLPAVTVRYETKVLMSKRLLPCSGMLASSIIPYNDTELVASRFNMEIRPQHLYPQLKCLILARHSNYSDLELTVGELALHTLSGRDLNEHEQRSTKYEVKSCLLFECRGGYAVGGRLAKLAILSLRKDHKRFLRRVNETP